MKIDERELRQTPAHRMTFRFQIGQRVYHNIRHEYGVVTARKEWAVHDGHARCRSYQLDISGTIMGFFNEDVLSETP